MTSRRDRTSLLAPDAEALFRYALVSDVLARELRGVARSNAVREVAALDHADLDGESRATSRRTLYRWLAAFERQGFAALGPAPRARIETSAVLPPALVDFLRDQKARDPAASLPEILRRARADQILAPAARVDRTTLWREARRAGLAVAHRRGRGPDADQRRFAYPHRMQMTLADGKHFRAGPTRLRRVALFFLDDATRFGLGVVVGTAEEAEVFLDGLYEVVRRHGLMEILYLDRGPGFFALDTREVVRRLGIKLIYGRGRYPEGHGKIERFNRTASPVLRALDGRPDVDPDLGALTLRLRHYLDGLYNGTPHEELDHTPPAERFAADPRPLRFPPSDAHLRDDFVVFFERRVTHDHLIPIDGTDYELPRGHAGSMIRVHHRLLDRRYAIVHDGRLVEIHPVDLAANARARRARPGPAGSATRDDSIAAPPEPTAADRLYQRDLAPVVDADGGCPDPQPDAEDP